jgi:bifunctional DNase/RNase
MKAILDATGARLQSVEIADIRESTYFALLHIEGNGETVSVDARPSDAIALALRCGAHILVSDTVLAQSSIPSTTVPEGGEKDKWTELLEKMDPEQFSKYKM